MFGKKPSESVKKTFFYSHEYRAQNMGGKKFAKQFFQKHTYRATNKCWEKFVVKKCEKTFLIFIRI